MAERNINWFPGHMAKTLREMKEKLAQVDVVIETADARLPQASRNPEIIKLLQDKPSVLSLTKSDLADPGLTGEWVDYYSKIGTTVRLLDIPKRRGLTELAGDIEVLARPRRERWEKRGIAGQKVRIMVVGIPNTGKSTLINAMAKRQAAKAENRPGVTRSAQWIKAGNDWLLLDMPGVLWPRLGTDRQKIALAASGAIKDNVLEIEELAYFSFLYLLERYPERLKDRYKLEEKDIEEWRDDPYVLFEIAAKRRSYLMSGGRADLRRFADGFLHELRNGQIGRISFEAPTDLDNEE